MQVEFNKFRFDTENGLLTCEGKPIYLKPKQQALLSFFIENAGTTLSKEQILETVWRERVVSEQVVFQTISQLRAIIGERAIQTYSRRGYKWNVPIQEITEKAQSTPVLVKQKTQYKHRVFIILLLIMLVLGFWLTATLNPKPTIIHTLPFNSFDNIQLKSSQGSFELTPLTSPPPFSADFLTMPRLIWQSRFDGEAQWLLGGRIYTLTDGVLLEFRLQGDGKHWHDYIFSRDSKQLNLLLERKISELHRLGLFNPNQTPAHWINLLRELSANTPQPSVDLFLAKHFDALGHTDIALAYLTSILRLPDLSENMPIKLKAALQMALIHKHRGQYETALETLNTVDTHQLSQIWPLKFELIKTRAFLAYAMRNPEQVSAQLQYGAELAKQNIDAIGRFQLHILDSILSAKLGLNERKYVQLNEAQQLITEQQLHPANLAFVYLHYVLFSKDNDSIIKYLEKIIKLPRTQHNFWVIDDSFERLFNQYLKADNLTAASALLAHNNAETVNHSLLQAKLLLVQNQTQQAIALLEQSYQQSQRGLDKNGSINAARALYQYLDTQDNKRQLYHDFLLRNGEQKWLERQHNEPM
ncbi:winged helix-turn-helix domain-containing protein [Pseudoalteromonas sp. MMG022]|uniref:winged helix-turn-helix domain-containing protein n=1 Tax=Pseudoalteromonas sp. MMG022 TaxID=2909978 RepID=UPI001F01E7DF|nr:winged helix-turn-helix domain-containing protein [Pseudoalteromonas sp. MMG022]MCF6437040.1 winged helix-turn-helix domain-containing protein [Pseudoalteromonas sp. MMG022]